MSYFGQEDIFYMEGLMCLGRLNRDDKARVEML